MMQGKRSKHTLITIVGATGTGKSQLAVELATRFNGEIINGDAMQLYDGLPIITNKIPTTERNGIPHHLLGRIGLNEPTWTVGKFVENAVNVIEEIRARGKLPILVGGTHYYTQALLFTDRLLEDEEKHEDENGEADLSILQESTDVILAKLREVDPIMADRWHPNDRRKIQRSLEIFLKTGKTASKTYEEQVTQIKEHITENDDTEDTAQKDDLTTFRYSTLLFWLHASKDVLYPRLDSRVLDMVQSGLLDEVDTLDKFRRLKEAAGENIDRTRGIWVSIGYKEFEAYQQYLSSDNALGSQLVKLKEKAIEQTQAATRQYSNRQARWIRIKLLNAISHIQALSCMFLLDGTDLTKWNEHVLQPAQDLTEKFLSGEPLPEPTSLSEAAKEMLTPKKDDISQRRDLWLRRTCNVCGVTSVTAADWEKHIKSRGHHKAIASNAKREQRVSGTSPVG
jgi:tRNA dimethylallyltransferase